jgi:hypothetical protein
MTASPQRRHPRDDFTKRSALLLSQRNWDTNRNKTLMTAPNGLTLEACLPNGPLARSRIHSRGPN